MPMALFSTSRTLKAEAALLTGTALEKSDESVVRIRAPAIDEIGRLSDKYMVKEEWDASNAAFAAETARITQMSVASDSRLAKTPSRSVLTARPRPCLYEER